MSKRQTDVNVAESLRKKIDAVVNQQVGLQIAPLQEFLDLHPAERKALENRYGKISVSLTRVLNRDLLIEYRLFPDPLYLKAPSGIRDITTAFELFKARWFLPVRMSPDDKRVVSYHPPILIGGIPRLFQKPVEHCFQFSKSPGNENRIDCSVISMAGLEWVPIQGQQTLMDYEPSLGVALLELSRRFKGLNNRRAA